MDMDTVSALQVLLETLEGYQGGVNCFLAFCSANNIPLSFPSPEWLVCAFAAHRAGSCSGSAVANNVAGLRAWHIANGLPWLGGTCLKYVLRSVMLETLYSSLDTSLPLHVCVLACADVVFWGQGRLGEFLPTSQSRFSHKFFPTPACLRSMSSGESLMCCLPWTKVSKERGEDIFLGRQLGPSDPISSLIAHLVASPEILASPASSHLFAYSGGAGRLISLTKCKFLLVCNSVWMAQGLPRISGHCFCIGRTTKLLLCNVPPHIVKVMGCWSSDSFLRYWRNLEHIAPLHAELLDFDSGNHLAKTSVDNHPRSCP
ncbi:hypothetical protein BDR05DRAFT_974962 [Suillus weaverae]|nr:hypothetical protein BDR05DRAFT_974962 [Suillus weaverae]